MSIKIIVDSTTDLTNSTRNRVTVVPLTVCFGADEYIDGVNLTHKEFYEKLIESDTLPTTSQATPSAFMKALDDVLEQGDSAVIITLSSKLSGTYQSAVIAASDYENVYVVDSSSVAIGTSILTEFALQCLEEGMSAAEIVETLEKKKEDVCLIAMLDTLEYLKKGGRVTPAAAMIGTVLNIKPVLTIQGEKLDAFEKARGVKQAKKAMIKAMKKDMDKRFAKERAAGIMGLHIAYTANDKEVIDGWIAEVKEAFPDFEVDAHPLSLSVACHIGPGALALACCKKITV